MVATKANALGDYLRTRRQQLRPDDVGLVPGTRRRVPGLRREEVATLAGISSAYYLRLEARCQASNSVGAADVSTPRPRIGPEHFEDGGV